MYTLREIQSQVRLYHFVDDNDNRNIYIMNIICQVLFKVCSIR